MEKRLGPAAHAEAQVLEAILNGEFAPGTALPAERILAVTLGVTRPTLRETLQRLAARGWVTISQGRPTRVNDYLDRGGLALLGSMVEYEKGMTPAMVEHLLGVRQVLLPGIAGIAWARDPRALREYLETRPGPGDSPERFARYDWGLHLLMVKLTGNPVFKFMFNDFEAVFQNLGRGYFSRPDACRASLDFYRELFEIIGESGDAARVEHCVRQAMATSIDLWRSRCREVDPWNR